jgi:hypothetical protein
MSNFGTSIDELRQMEKIPDMPTYNPMGNGVDMRPLPFQ